ncbi:MAG: hypothetical protein MUO62_02045 [Anaerolineales bacterium]|nr:hypothetical protein [Anaerolineales bacterium]
MIKTVHQRLFANKFCTKKNIPAAAMIPVPTNIRNQTNAFPNSAKITVDEIDQTTIAVRYTKNMRCSFFSGFESNTTNNNTP